MFGFLVSVGAVPTKMVQGSHEEFQVGDIVGLNAEGRRAFPTKISSLPWVVVSTKALGDQVIVRVEHKGQRVNHLVRESLSENWLELIKRPTQNFTESEEIALEEIIRKVVCKMDQEHFFDQDKGEGEQ